MSGLVGGVDYSLLFSGSNTASQAESSILNALYSGNTYASQSTAVSTGNPLIDLKLAQANQAIDVANETKQPQIARDIAAFKQGIANATTIDGALSNLNVLKILLTANNLANQVAYPGLVKKVLLSDPSASTSLVNQLGNAAYTSAVKTYNFAKNGLAELRDPAVISTLTNAYAEVMWRRSLDQATPGLSNALAFLSQAKSIKKVDDILGDPINRAVVTTALGIPEQIAFQDLPTQESAISTRLDVANLQDPKFVASLTDQYLLAKQQQALQNPSGPPDLSTLAEQLNGLVV